MLEITVVVVRIVHLLVFVHDDLHVGSFLRHVFLDEFSYSLEVLTCEIGLAVLNKPVSHVVEECYEIVRLRYTFHNIYAVKRLF